jgi:hypothetical protein
MWFCFKSNFAQNYNIVNTLSDFVYDPRCGMESKTTPKLCYL